MSVVFILVFVAIIMAGAFLVSFIWAVKSGQYEDTYTPSIRILFDELPMKEADSHSDQSQLTEDRRTETADGRTDQTATGAFCNKGIS
jgi:cbb3-type cytochrome oxidase maturation protein